MNWRLALDVRESAKMNDWKRTSSMGDNKVTCSGCGKEYELLVQQEIVELVHKGLMQFYCAECSEGDNNG